MRRCLNLGSYNYLGFANQDPYCTPQVLDALDKYGWGPCSSRADAGAPRALCRPALLMSPSMTHGAHLHYSPSCGSTRQHTTQIHMP